MTLNEMKKLWAEEGFRPDRKLGQNFLVDKNVRDNILHRMALDPAGNPHITQMVGLVYCTA